MQLAHKIEENTKQVAKVGLDLVAVAGCNQGLQNEIASISNKVATLEKAVLQHTTTLDHVAKKINHQTNETLATDTNSIKKKIAEIEQNLQGIDKLGTEFKHLDARVRDLKITAYSNTNILNGIKTGINKTHYDPAHKKFKHQFHSLWVSINNREKEIKNKYVDYEDYERTAVEHFLSP